MMAAVCWESTAIRTVSIARLIFTVNPSASDL